MIGVIADESDLPVLKEFFELFKTPWETCRTGKRYPVVLSVLPGAPLPESDLTVVYGYEPESPAGRSRRSGSHPPEGIVLSYREHCFPVYAGCSTLESSGRVLVTHSGTNKPAGVETSKGGGKHVRLGYDLVEEVRFLLTSGQPVEHAAIPTLEIHISILRNLILDCGLPLAEIPPVPPGCDLIVCLTHDVDFTSIRLHRIDRTVLGFAYRATILSADRFLKGQLAFGKLLRNLWAVLSLPLVYAGLVKDFFNQFERYLELEGDLKSTFFIIPHKDIDGRSPGGEVARGRATRYDVDDIGQEVAALLDKGCEVGVHGLDAWHDPKRAEEERAKISKATGTDPVGIRVHWLYFSERTPRVLEEAGFSYDSTWGYNDCVGFRSGTTQAFRPLGVRRLLELPLHIQDTALFYPARMGLTLREGMRAIEEVVSGARKFGGAVTVNWHTRSLGPERWWGDPYQALLRLAKQQGIWGTSARQVVEWFALRRSARFSDIDLPRGRICVTVEQSGALPGLQLRLHNVPSGVREKMASISFPGNLVFAG